MNESTQQQTGIGGTQSEVASESLTRGFNSLSSHHLKQAQCPHDVTKILISRGLFALIDTADLPMVGDFRWQALKSGYTYYAHIPRLGLMHRLLLGLPGGRFPETDHIDGNGLNNTRGNLRIVNRSVNMQNRRKMKSRSRFTGVKPNSNGLRWCARIYHNDKPILLGTHDTEEQAAMAYDKAALALFGPQCRLNLPTPTA